MKAQSLHAHAGGGIARLRQRLQRGQKTAACPARGAQALLHAAARVEGVRITGHGGVEGVANGRIDLALAILQQLQLPKLACDVQANERRTRHALRPTARADVGA